MSGERNLILFFDKGKLKLGFKLNENYGRPLIITEDNQEKFINKSQIAYEFNIKSDTPQGNFKKIRELEKEVDLETVWEISISCPDVRELSPEEISNLIFQKISTDTICAILLKLHSEENIYFKKKGEKWEIRPEEEVERIKKEKEMIEENRKRLEKIKEWFEENLKSDEISFVKNKGLAEYFSENYPRFPEQVPELVHNFLQELKDDFVNERKDEIKKILKVEKELGKLEYKDLEQLLKSNDDSISLELKKLIELLREKHEEINNFLNEEWENNVINQQKFTRDEEHFYRIPIDSGFYKNFLFFNNSLGNLEQKDSFYNAICFNFNKEEMLKKIDKSVNKFLPSENEFSNINYTELSTKEFKSQIEYLFVYLLCFTYAFEKYENLGYVTFYSNDLELSYIINKKLKLYKKKIEKSKDPNIILRVTWQQVIDSLVEYKSSWSLENMYIISYKRLDNQSQENIEYIGIPKLQASILLDDTIRYNLNNRIQFRSKNFENNFCWLLEEFIKGKPLYPIILNHINLVLNEETSLKINPSTYSLIVDAKILELRSKNKGKSPFSNDFFDVYKSLAGEIKKDLMYTSFSASLVKKFSKDDDTKRRIARELFGALKEKNKNIFLNILLKNMNEDKKLCSNNNLNNFIFEKIIKNDTSYEMYGLLLIMNLLRGERN